MPTDAEILDQWYADYGHDRLTQYEDAAEAFYRDTGLMAPGKSEPMGWAWLHSQEERSERWEAWCKARADARMSAVARLRADLADARKAALDATAACLEARADLAARDADLATVTAERDRLRDVLADMVSQFAYQTGDRRGVSTGGLSALEDAFDALGWKDPHYPDAADRAAKETP